MNYHGCVTSLKSLLKNYLLWTIEGVILTYSFVYPNSLCEKYLFMQAWHTVLFGWFFCRIALARAMHSSKLWDHLLHYKLTIACISVPFLLFSYSFWIVNLAQGLILYMCLAFIDAWSTTPEAATFSSKEKVEIPSSGIGSCIGSCNKPEKTSKWPIEDIEKWLDSVEQGYFVLNDNMKVEYNNKKGQELLNKYSN